VVALLHQTFQHPKPGLADVGYHRITVTVINSKSLGTDDPVQPGFDKPAPEVKVFPSPWDVGVATNLLPALAAN
jgi:hypothetical protein